MTEQSHGRYYAQEVALDGAGGTREQIQEALDAGEAQDWNLIGAADVSAASSGVPVTEEAEDEGTGASSDRGARRRAVILFWDTARPSFGRTSG